MKVGLFDSGIGGWSFLKKIKNYYPQHTYLYFADQKNCPYGNKSLSELESIAEEWINLIKTKEIDILIIACNTMTAWFKQKFKKELKIPVFGTTDGLEKQKINEQKLVLLATVKTVQSQWYQKLFPEIDMCQIGNTWLAKTIEKRFSLTSKEKEKLKKEVEEAAGEQWNKMILGCTHYPLIESQLKKIWPEKEFIDPADTILNEIRYFLNNGGSVDNKIIMYTTGESELLESQVRSFFNEKEQEKIMCDKI